MSELSNKLEMLNSFYEQAPIKIKTLGQFTVFRNKEKLSSKEFGDNAAVAPLLFTSVEANVTES